MTGKKIPLAGVIGSPISHSKSPKLHQHWLRRYGIDGHYVPMAVAPEDLETALRALPRLGFRGVNVTIPHKERALGLADSVTDRAASIGAANTLTFGEGGRIEVVAVVHSETPCGTLNPVWEIGPIARKHGAVTVVDCVSSWAGIELKPEEWQLDLLVAGPQKCLGGPPGMSLLAVSEQAWAVIEANPMAPRASILSILDWREKWHRDGAFPYTPSVSDLNGVHAACAQLLDEGLDGSIARHRRVFDASWAAVEAMGLTPCPLSKDIASACVTAVRLPDGLGDIQVRDLVRERYGVQISAGQGAGDLVRIGHLGDTARPMLAVAGLAALGQGLRDLGAAVDVGAAVDGAMASLSASAS